MKDCWIINNFVGSVELGLVSQFFNARIAHNFLIKADSVSKIIRSLEVRVDPRVDEITLRTDLSSFGCSLKTLICILHEIISTNLGFEGLLLHSSAELFQY